MSPNLRLLLLFLTLTVSASAQAQTVAPASTRAATPQMGRATTAWTLKAKGDIRWQQVTPAGTLLLSTDATLMGIDTDRGQVLWEKPELGGLTADSIRMVDGSLLMEAARQGLPGG